ncbi:MAG: divergent polysaccharide deacetylase family protein [Pseudomonadales bacterium]
MPVSATVRIPRNLSLKIGILLATAALSLPAFLIAQPARAATTLTASTLLIVPEARLLPQRHKLAIVIDDMGYSLHQAERILRLPPELTLAMLPYAPHSREIAEEASRAGREIILHQPMEPLAGDQEPGTLELDMSAERFEAQLEDSLARLPEIRGVNNHTGSLLTAHRGPMERLMHGISGRGLYFLDSRTTPDTVAESTARAYHVPTIHRDVFLDHEITEPFLAHAFEKSVAIARRRGYAVVIAHPHPLTLEFLERALAGLPPDVELAQLSTLIQGQLSPLDRRALALRGSPAFRSRSPGQ